MINNGKEILANARAEGYAIGGFNVVDYASTEMVLQAAEQKNVPIMLMIGDFTNPNAQESRYMKPFDAKNLSRFIVDRSEASPVPVLIHLDHCPTYEGCMRAIQNGATSVMIDASMAPFEENVRLTKKVIDAAHACGVLVEAEIGHVSGHANSTGVQYTEVEDAKRFYEETGVDLLAVSIGTVHGVYASEPSLNYDRIAELKESIPVPLVMHGASGLRPDQFKDAVKAGIAKINFATYLMLEGARGMAEQIAKDGDNARFANVLKAGTTRATEYVKMHLDLFGTKPWVR